MLQKLLTNLKCFSRNISGSVLVTSSLLCGSYSANAQIDFVKVHGQLSVKGANLVDQCGNNIQLKGMSLFWSSYSDGSKYFNENTVKNLVNDYKCTVVRAPLGIAPPSGTGYESDANQANLVIAVIDACIKYGIYVIPDFHAHDAPAFQSKAITFFTQIANRYKGVPNIIYEIYNEPKYDTDGWVGTILPYEQAVVNAIRAIDTKNVIVCGTPTYDQNFADVIKNKVSGTNLMYTMHFYAATAKHQLGSDWVGANTKTAVAAGLPLFVTEYGTVEQDGNGAFDAAHTQEWWTYLDAHNISYVNWGIYDKNESAAALKSNTTTSGSWSDANLTQSGSLVLNHIKSTYSLGTCTVSGVEDKSLFRPSLLGSVLNIHSSENTQLNICIIDMTGRIVMQSANHFTNEDIQLGNGLEKGMYVVQVVYQNSTLNYKLMKE